MSNYLDTLIIQDFTMEYHDGEPIKVAMSIEIQPGCIPTYEGDDLILPRCLITKVIGVENADLVGKFVSVRIKPDGTTEFTVCE